MGSNIDEIQYKMDSIEQRMRDQEERVRLLKQQQDKDLRIKREVNRIKQEDIDRELERQGRLKGFKKEQVIEKCV